MSWHGVPVPYDDRDDWLAKRRQGIGASDVAGILNMSPYSTPFTVWDDKVNGSQKTVTEAMHFGKVLEDVIADEFTARQGIHVGMRETLVRHPKFPWVMATVDGVGFESPVDGYGDPVEFDVDAALGLVQFKTDGSWGPWEDIPDHYQIQVQWEMLATGFTTGWMPVLHNGKRLEIYPFEADPGVQNRILDKVSDFRAKHILGGVDAEPLPPEVDAHPATTRAIADLWADPTEGKTIELSDQMAADLDALSGWKQEKSLVDAEVKRLENRIKVSLQDAEVGTIGGREVVTWRQTERKGYAVKPTTFRVLRIKTKET